MSTIPIYNKDGKVYIDQSITAGESSNKVANAKFVVDTVNAKVDNFRQVTDNSFSQVVTPINSSLNTLKSVVDASFVKLGDGSITVGTALNASTASNASLATNLARTSGIVYQSANSVTATLDYNGAGKLLMSNSPGTEYPRILPSWVSPSDLNVGNIAGGSPGQLLYQSASNTTSKIANGTSGQILKSNGSDAPSWVTGYYDVDKSYVDLSLNGLRTDINNRIDTLVGLTTPESLDTFGEIATFITETSGNLIKTMLSVDASFNSLKNGDIVVKTATDATNIIGGSAGDLLYQSNSNTTAKLSIGTSGQILQVNGSGLSWSNDISSNGNVYAGSRLGFTSNETVTLDEETNSTVTLNRPCGKIILNSFIIQSPGLIDFDLYNNLIASGDVLILNQISGSVGSYLLNATCEANKATIYVRNLSGGQIEETNMSIQYVLIKASS